MQTPPNDLGIYERMAARWWEPRGPFRALRALNGPRFAHWDPVAGSLERKTCVDLGCGGGFVAAELVARGGRVVGLDRSRGALRAARSAPGADRGAYVEADARAAPLRDAVADVVVCADVLEHLDAAGRLALLREAARILKPGGLLLYDTVNRTWLARLVVAGLLESLGVVPRGTHDPRLFVTPAELERDMAAVELIPGSRTGFLFLGIPGRAPFRLTRWEALCYVGSASKAPATPSPAG